MAIAANEPPGNLQRIALFLGLIYKFGDSRNAGYATQPHNPPTPLPRHVPPSLAAAHSASLPPAPEGCSACRLRLRPLRPASSVSALLPRNRLSALLPPKPSRPDRCLGPSVPARPPASASASGYYCIFHLTITFAPMQTRASNTPARYNHQESAALRVA